MNSQQGNFTFHEWGESDFISNYSQRNGETRLGDVLKSNVIHSAKYVIIGIQESCGPLANHGRSGAENAFPAFLQAYLNTQCYGDYPADKIYILGSVQACQNKKESDLGQKVNELDNFLFDLLSKYLSPAQIPIFIGGGHNNALPLIRWSAQHKKTAVINLDAHADLRNTDIRHSGNSFSTSLSEGTLCHYSVLGLHEAYNNSFIREFLKKDHIFHTYFESYLFEKRNLIDDLSNILRHFHTDTQIGLEIDMDSIAFMPSSALSPSGWSLDQVRQFVHHFRQKQPQIAYLNLTEAAPINEQEKRIVGKALSYLLRDFTGI